MEEIIKAARALAQAVTEESLEWDDPNGPYRCFLCSAPTHKGHTDDCIYTQAWKLLSLIDSLEVA